MKVQPNLTERHQHILWATIHHYIATAEPVGSKTLAEEYDLKVSSATIRNTMGRLEKVGLLYQPHTSSGRIPSDFGYRIYVDQLITPDEIWGRKIEQSLHQELKSKRCNFEALLQRVAQMLATISGYIALITMPQNSTSQLVHLQLVRVSSQQIMLIIVTDSYQSQSLLIDSSGLFTEEAEIEEELRILSNFLNHKLKTKSLTELASIDTAELAREFENYADFLKTVFAELKSYTQLVSGNAILVRGISEVLRQPEFSQLEQVQMLLHLLEKKQDQLFPLMFALPEKVTIKIGSENHLEPMRSFSLVAANYHACDVPVGSVGIIGPTRMFYENAIALVESTADYLSETLNSE